MKAVYYQYAKYLKSDGKVEEAMSYFFKSGNHGFEIPRMLSQSPDLMHLHLEKAKDPALRNWWAHNCEARGDLETACGYYKESNDINSFVRVLCQMDKLDEATAVAEESGDSSACFFLARQFEHSDEVESAIHWYSKAKCFGHAVRLAKEREMYQELVRLALLGNKDLIRNIAM